MSDRQLWDQMIEEGEPDLWYGRFRAYLLMGIKRSVNAVFAKEARKDGKRRGIEAPGAWYDTEKTWKWKERARAYDESVRVEEDRIIAEEKEKILRSGYALMHKRVQELDRLSRRLVAMTKDEDKVWLPDVKSIQVGIEIYERVDLVHFNAPLFTLIEKYFASIAAELGERVKKQELTGKNGGPLEVREYVTEWGGGSLEEDEDDEG